MIILGCDFHPSWQQIAWLDTETGETGAQQLVHAEGQAEQFYRGLSAPVLIGMEATGNSQWFVELVEDLGHEIWIGDAAQIRASYVRKQKTDKRDAAHMLKLLVEGRFPRLWMPGREQRDLRQLVLHRHKLVVIRARVKNELQHLSLNKGMQRKGRLWSEQGLQLLRGLRLKPWASCRREDLLGLLTMLDQQIGKLDQAVQQAAEQNSQAKLLMTQPGDSNRTKNFMYDSLNRIQQAYTSGPNWGETFSPVATAPGVAPTTSGIDAWGNLTNRSGVTGKTNFESLSASATTKNQLTGFGYDAAGNMSSNGSATYTYDAENRITSSAGCTFTYDGDGSRVQKTGCGSIVYWRDLSGNPLEEANTSGTMLREYVFFNGQRIARRDVSTNNVFYFFSDHLGSTSLVTNPAGAMPPQMESDYYPYGGEIPITTGIQDQNYKFTGKERDTESGLDNFKARYFGSNLGRFQTSDPVLVSWRRIVNPQLWNAYSYAGNNPLRFVDPTGEDLIQLGQHTDDQIKERTHEINQQLKSKDLTKDEKSALKKEKNTLSLEQQGNHVVGNLLAKLDQTGQRNGLQLSNFTLSTDTKNDFAGLVTPDAMKRITNDQAFVIQQDKKLGGTIYIRTQPVAGFYQMSQQFSDFAYFGASAISHEQVHLNGGGEYPAYQRQLGVFEGFHDFFQNENVYRGLDEEIRDGIKANQP